MSPGVVVAIVFAALIAYALAGSAVSGLAKRFCPHWFSDSTLVGDPVPFLTGFFWPLTLIALVCVGSYRRTVRSPASRVRLR